MARQCALAATGDPTLAAMLWLGVGRADLPRIYWAINSFEEEKLAF